MKYLDYKTLQLRISLTLVWCLLLLTACDDGSSPATPEENKYLIESTKIAELSKETIAAQVGAISPILPALVKNGVTVYKITYHTRNTDGADITASGALFIPDTDQEASMISIQHGTIYTDASAPSNFQPGQEASNFGSMSSSIGYIVSYPDYIGYGASKDYPHPYEHRESLASSCLDMLRAAKEFIKSQKDVKWNQKLYLGGYSEGGYATMSLQKKIEEEAASEFNLKASSCGAGAYDKTAFMNNVINNETPGAAKTNKLYLWVLLTYDRLYKLNRPKTYYFNEPYATQIEQNGIDANINVSFNKILTKTFIDEINNGTNKGFIDAVADNNNYNWKPNTPTRLIHGDKDPVVLYLNSVNALAAMKKLGAKDVELITIPNGTHESSIDDYLINTLSFFQTPPYL